MQTNADDLRSLSSLLRVGLLVVPPVLAIFYRIAAIIFLGVWNEDSWQSLVFHRRNSSLFLSWCLVVVSVVWACDMVSSPLSSFSSTTIVVWTVLNGMLSAYWMRDTRCRLLIGDAFLEYERQSSSSSSSLKDKIILITGANSGIGYETANECYQRGAKCVILACRSLQRAQAAKQDILKQQQKQQSISFANNTNDDNQNDSRIQILPLDLSSLSSIETAVDQLLPQLLFQLQQQEQESLSMTLSSSSLPKIDLLINNAGLISGPQLIHTLETGVEQTIMANAIGPYYFTRLIHQKGLFRSSSNSTTDSAFPSSSSSLSCILNVTSCTYTFICPHLPIDTPHEQNLLLYCSSSLSVRQQQQRRPQQQQGVSSTSSTVTKTAAMEDDKNTKTTDEQRQQYKYSLYYQYAASKLANIMFTLEWRRRRTRHEHQQQQYEQTAPSLSNLPLPPYPIAYSIHPGMVRTPVVKHLPWYLYYPNLWFGFVVALFQKTPAQGAACTICVAEQAMKIIAITTDTTTTATNGSSAEHHEEQPDCINHNNNSKGRNKENDKDIDDIDDTETDYLCSDLYFVNGHAQEVWPCAKDAQRAKQLWNLFADIVGLPP